MNNKVKSKGIIGGAKSADETCKMCMNDIKSIKQQSETMTHYIDMDIVEFIKRVQEKTFQEVHSMLQLIEMEHSRLLSVRSNYAKKFAEVRTNSKDFDNIFMKYICSFVVERKILDRKAIIEHLSTLKGVQSAMSPVEYNDHLVGAENDLKIDFENDSSCTIPRSSLKGEKDCVPRSNIRGVNSNAFRNSHQ